MTEPDHELHKRENLGIDYGARLRRGAWELIKTIASLAAVIIMINGVFHHMALNNDGGAGFYGILAFGFAIATIKCLYNLAQIDL